MESSQFKYIDLFSTGAISKTKALSLRRGTSVDIARGRSESQGEVGMDKNHHTGRGS